MHSKQFLHGQSQTTLTFWVKGQQHKRLRMVESPSPVGHALSQEGTLQYNSQWGADAAKCTCGYVLPDCMYTLHRATYKGPDSPESGWQDLPSLAGKTTPPPPPPPSLAGKTSRVWLARPPESGWQDLPSLAGKTPPPPESGWQDLPSLAGKTPPPPRVWLARPPESGWQDPPPPPESGWQDPPPPPPPSLAGKTPPSLASKTSK